MKVVDSRREHWGLQCRLRPHDVSIGSVFLDESLRLLLLLLLEKPQITFDKPSASREPRLQQLCGLQALRSSGSVVFRRCGLQALWSSGSAVFRLCSLQALWSSGSSGCQPDAVDFRLSVVFCRLWRVFRPVVFRALWSSGCGLSGSVAAALWSSGLPAVVFRRCGLQALWSSGAVVVRLCGLQDCTTQV
ncbi:hypothetical protein JOB18_043733 [Solea senegalensis]|uniref:Uncharacterized protein n=1 Tax=Solea senegalensis TaxID=28829 RepID=A0AAV6SKP5_SOLSE|nr:hypothetical protein JOB18_043733 [Solea senegalensis]